MNLNIIKRPELTVAYIDNFLSRDDYAVLEKEIRYLYQHRAPADLKRSAYKRNRETGEIIPLKNAYTISLDDHYYLNFDNDRDRSFILGNLTRRFFSKDLSDRLKEEAFHYRNIESCDLDNTIINFYTDGQDYKPHTDRSLISFIYFANIGKVKPGDFYLEDIDFKLPSINNRLVIIPGYARHGVFSSSCESDDSYRCSIATFGNFNTNIKEELFGE